jgi:hypothetical protein
MLRPGALGGEGQFGLVGPSSMTGCATGRSSRGKRAIRVGKGLDHPDRRGPRVTCGPTRDFGFAHRQPPPTRSNIALAERDTTIPLPATRRRRSDHRSRTFSARLRTRAASRSRRATPMLHSGARMGPGPSGTDTRSQRGSIPQECGSLLFPGSPSGWIQGCLGVRPVRSEEVELLRPRPRQPPPR